eukprot:2278214-Pyramimonas_sp.AAC.1
MLTRFARSSDAAWSRPPASSRPASPPPGRIAPAAPGVPSRHPPGQFPEKAGRGLLSCHPLAFPL